MAEELGLIPNNKQDIAISKYDFTENSDIQLYIPNYQRSERICVREFYFPET